MKFATIYKRSAALDNVKKHNTYPDGLSHRVGYLVDSARINADDTVHVEKSAPDAEYDAIAMRTLEGLLCDSKDEAVCDWFRKQGVRW